MLLFFLALAAVDHATQSISLPEPIDPEKWIVHTDYPEDALRAGQSGTVWFEVSVNEAGKPYACRVLTSSKVPSLDRISCAAMMSRARFRPALDGGRQPLPGVFRRSASWAVNGSAKRPEPGVDLILPVSRIPARAKPVATLRVVETATGLVEACEVEMTSQSPQLDELACNAVLRAKMPDPLAGPNGAPVRAVRSRRVAFEPQVNP